MKKEKIRSLTVEEFTTPCSISVPPSKSLKEVEDIMRRAGIRHLPVIKKNEVIGIVSERDVHCAYRIANAETLKVRDIMNETPYIVDESTKISEVAFAMSERKIGSAIVKMREGEIGIFTSTDALNALIEIVRGDVIE